MPKTTAASTWPFRTWPRLRSTAGSGTARTTPSPAAPDYGADTWLNRPSGTDREVLFSERGPDTLFAAVGHLGQYVLVSPQQRLTVVRLGKTDEEDRAALVDALADVVELYPLR